MKIDLKKLIILATLTFLLIGIVCATETNKTTTTKKIKTIKNTTKTPIKTPTKSIKESNKKINIQTKNIIKKDPMNTITKQKLKTATSTTKTVTFKFKKQKQTKSKQVGSDKIYAWYQKQDEQYDKGIWVTNQYEYKNNWDFAPHTYRLTKAKFYYKNVKGKVITRTTTAKSVLQYSELSGKQIKNYTPYKVIVYYRKMTAKEQKKNMPYREW